jgi:hypothetical protein
MPSNASPLVVRPYTRADFNTCLRVFHSNLLLIQFDTSQHSAGFFERFGSRVQATVTNGFGESLDCLAMRLRRDDWAAEGRNTVLARSSHVPLKEFP